MANKEKILKYLIWAGLIAICFIPLLIDSDYFFPYIVPKTLAFRIITEVLFLAYLILAIAKKEYRPRLNLVLVLFSLYLVAVFVSSISGGNFYFSFWSNNERSEGLLLLLHLLLFLLVLSSFMRKFSDWLVILDASFLGGLAVSSVALAQYLHLDWILASSGGERLASTIGNAGYVAGYLVFNILFGFVLLFSRKNKYLRSYYILGLILQIFVVFNTLTRGGILALFFSLFIFGVYLVFFYWRGKRMRVIRRASIGVILFLVIFIALIFVYQKADWVKNNNILERVASISIQAPTAQNRLMTWQSAYLGFKEKPLLGYGYENFYQVFDKYFNPKIYRHVGSVVWFDRAHNIIFDRLITGGLIGLFLYLSLLFVPLIYLWRHFYKEGGTRQDYLIPVAFTLIMLAYFIQNFFIFEAVVTYIPLFLTLAFLSQFSPTWADKFFQSKKPWLVLLTLGVILYFPVLLSANIKPASANKSLLKAMLYTRQGKAEPAYKQFVDTLEKDTFGNQEYRQHFGDFASRVASSPDLDAAWQKEVASKAETEFDKQIQERPLNARNYLMFMRFLNKTHKFDIERLNKALDLGQQAVSISPTRPQIYIEIAYSQVYLGKYYQSLDQNQEAEELFNQAVENGQKAIDLQERVVESHINMAMILLALGRGQELQVYINKMEEIGLDYKTETALSRMANSATHSQDYNWTKRFYRELTEISPTTPDYWINLALSHAYLGEKDRAIEIADIIKEFGSEYEAQANLFIEQVLSGDFEQ